MKCEYCSREAVKVAERSWDAFTIGGGDVYKCDCGLYFTPRKEEEYRQFFEKEYHEKRRSLSGLLRRYPSRSHPLHMLKRVKKLFIKSPLEKLILKYLPPPARILEVGCGSYPLISLELFGYRYTGIDPDRELTKALGSKGWDIRQIFLEDWVGKVDGVVAVSALNYCFDIKRAIKAIHDTGGILFVTGNEALSGSYNRYNFADKFWDNMPFKVIRLKRQMTV